MNDYNDNVTYDQSDKLCQPFSERLEGGEVSRVRIWAILDDMIDSGDRWGLNWKGKARVFAKIRETIVEKLYMNLTLQAEQQEVRSGGCDE